MVEEEPCSIRRSLLFGIRRRQTEFKKSRVQSSSEES